MFNFFHKTDPSTKYLSDLLSSPALKEDLLGIKEVELPTPERIIRDAHKIGRYSKSSDYQVFAQEAWARVLQHLDAVMDPKASKNVLDFERGALRATLDLLRLSHQARSIREQLEQEKATQVTPKP